MYDGAWEGVISPPIPGRAVKPRREGWTMVIDKGLGVDEIGDWLRLAGDYVDLVKLGFGTSVLYRKEVLAGKITLLREAGIAVMPGGTLAEIALLQDRFADYLERASELGFDTVEISDGTIPLDRRKRDEIIASARTKGFRVIAEVGKKHPAERLPLRIQAEEALADLAAGAEMVVIEARESGRGIGIYGPEGQIIPESLSFLAERLPWSRTIWEAPQKHQQEQLILRFGPNVNLGNIPPAEVLALEATRLGLRGDTLRSTLR